MRLLFFKAPWCSTCHAIENYVPKEFEHIDCDKQPEIAEKYGITMIPLFVCIGTNDNEIGRIQTTSIPALKNWVSKLED
jgi:thiol-disulfide isomerase/thioredoxin